MQPDGVEGANKSEQEQHKGLQQLPQMLSPTLINGNFQHSYRNIHN